MLEEKSYLVSVTVVDKKHIRAEQVTLVLKDGVEIARSEKIIQFTPDADVSGQDEQIQWQAKLYWTPEVVAAYKAEVAARVLANNPPPPVVPQALTATLGLAQGSPAPLA